MKGIIFNYLEEFVSYNYGHEAWDQLLDASILTNKDGVYITPGTYSDSDLFAIVETASKVTGLPIIDLVTMFGTFVVGKFYEDYPVFFKPEFSSKDFLLTIHDVIHVEVNKVFAGAKTPDFNYENIAEDRLVMKYSSDRKLCHLIRGMLIGLGDFYKEKIIVNEPICLHKGGDHCRLELSFSKIEINKNVISSKVDKNKKNIWMNIKLFFKRS